jgi:hypothetical protein
MKRLVWFCALFFVAGVLVPLAHADALSDLNKLYEQVPADVRPFPSFNDLSDLIQKCQDINTAEQCTDAIGNTPLGQEDGFDLIVMWIRVYFDLNPMDYWALAQDAGEAIACTAAQIILDVDVCGAIKALVEAAEAVAHDVQAALQFISDVLGVTGAALKEGYCDLTGGIFGGCDDGSPQPPPEVIAFTNYYYSRIPDGLWNREHSPAAWNTYKSAAISDCAAQTGQGAGCTKAYPAFEKAILDAWDADVVQHFITQVKKRQLSQWTAATANAHLVDIQGISFLSSDEPWAFNSVTTTLVSNECRTDLANQGSQKVQDWIDAGGYQHAGIPAPWTTSASLCIGFNDAFLNAARMAAATEGIARINQTGICSKYTDTPLIYDCQETSYKNSPQTKDCETTLSLGNYGPPNGCFAPKHWDCQETTGGKVSINKHGRQKQTPAPASTKYDSITLPAHQQPPAGCLAGDVNPGRPKVKLNCNGKIVEAEFGTQFAGCKLVEGIGVDPNAQCQQLQQEYQIALQNASAPNATSADKQKYEETAQALANANCGAGSQPGTGVQDPNHH